MLHEGSVLCGFDVGPLADTSRSDDAGLKRLGLQGFWDCDSGFNKDAVRFKGWCGMLEFEKFGAQRWRFGLQAFSTLVLEFYELIGF